MDYSFLNHRNIVLLDCETRVKPDPQGGISWTDYEKMGISVTGLIDFQTCKEHLYFEDNFQDLIDRINSADLVIGFNQRSFDMPLIRAVSQLLGVQRPLKPEEEIPLYDILEASRAGAGVGFAKGFKLSDHLAANLGPGVQKAGSGALAPDLWQQGKLGELLHYCLEDVRLTAQLLHHILEFGCLRVPSREPYRVQDPLEAYHAYRHRHGLAAAA